MESFSLKYFEFWLQPGVIAASQTDHLNISAKCFLSKIYVMLKSETLAKQIRKEQTVSTNAVQ